jgi:hypothetical protein
MSRWDDLPDAMRGERVDHTTLDRLLRGRTAPDDAPPGYSDVASVLLSAASPPVEEELSLEAQHVAAARNAIAHRTSERPIWRHRTLAGLMVVGGLLVIPGLAAANSLPDPAQHAVSRVFDKVGISVPDTQQAPATSVDHPASTGSEISNIATTTDATGVAKGALISSTASGGMSQAGQHGGATNPHGSARNPTPNAGGTGTPDTAHGGSADHGTATADRASGGRSAARSSNAP